MKSDYVVYEDMVFGKIKGPFCLYISILLLTYTTIIMVPVSIFSLVFSVTISFAEGIIVAASHPVASCSAAVGLGFLALKSMLY